MSRPPRQGEAGVPQWEWDSPSQVTLVDRALPQGRLKEVSGG